MSGKSVGFMQGRLSPVVKGKIQAFPWDSWQTEFITASSLGFSLLEWTLDQEQLYENPLMTKEGQAEINNLSRKYKIKIPSLTGDCFMQAPFWKLSGKEREKRKKDLIKIIEACSKIGVRLIVIPLVDEGSIENNDQAKSLLDFLNSIEDLIEKNYIDDFLKPVRISA